MNPGLANPNLREVVLDNGMKAVLVERRGLPVVATALFYRVGSRDERTGESGLAHFLEHMMFKGTDRYRKGEIDLITSKLGGSNNAFTDQDCTAYHFSLAADRWETALEIEANRMTACALDPAEFDAEKQVVLEELAMGQDDPWNQLWQSTEALTFQVHPYHRPVIGWREDLERVSRDAMHAFYRRHYGPNRAFLAVVGDIDAKAAEKRLRALFSGIAPVEERALVVAEPELRAERRGVVRAPGTLSRVALAARTCRVGEKDDWSLDILAHVLALARSSRLHRRLVLDEELATQVSAQNETRLDPGLFWVVAELRPGVRPERVEAVIRDEVQRIAEEGVTQAELKRARIHIRSSFLFEDETVLETALKLGRYETLSTAGWRLVDAVLAGYDALDRRTLRDAAARLFAPEAWTAVWSVPHDHQVERPRVRRRKAAPRARTSAPRDRKGAR
ncbi:MAG: insulinase family protein [Planctomycetes bacterium]|nr:insulinase family protein [Planctomycetota bacterium]